MREHAQPVEEADAAAPAPAAARSARGRAAAPRCPRGSGARPCARRNSSSLMWPSGRGQRDDDERQAAVEAALAPARDRARRALAAVRAQRVEHAAQRRGKQLQRRERPPPTWARTDHPHHPTAISATPASAGDHADRLARRMRSCRTARAREHRRDRVQRADARTTTLRSPCVLASAVEAGGRQVSRSPARPSTPQVGAARAAGALRTSSSAADERAPRRGGREHDVHRDRRVGGHVGAR